MKNIDLKVPADRQSLQAFRPDLALISPRSIAHIKGECTVRQLLPGIFHLVMANQRELAQMFLRFQEYSESPFFRGRIFTLGEYKAWYTRVQGQFSYYEDWAGFNIPSRVFAPFYRKEFKYQTRREKMMLDLFQGVEGRFYVIGTYEGDRPETLKHELAHGLFFTSDAYRDEVRRAMFGVPTTKFSRKLAVGYHPAVFEDEIHAYLLTDASYLLHKRELETTLPVMTKLAEIFARYSGIKPSNLVL